MLNGISPVIIFQFFEGLPYDLFSKIPIPTEVTKVIGAPIPIYLDMIDLKVVSESRSINIATDPKSKSGEGKPSPDQKLLESSLTIELVCVRDNLLTTALLGMADLIISKVVDKNYAITYMGISNIVLKGLLQSFTTNVSDENNKMTVSIVLSKATEGDTRSDPGAGEVTNPKVTAPAT